MGSVTNTSGKASLQQEGHKGIIWDHTAVCVGTGAQLLEEMLHHRLEGVCFLILSRHFIGSVLNVGICAVEIISLNIMCEWEMKIDMAVMYWSPSAFFFAGRSQYKDKECEFFPQWKALAVLFGAENHCIYSLSCVHQGRSGFLQCIWRNNNAQSLTNYISGFI